MRNPHRLNQVYPQVRTDEVVKAFLTFRIKKTAGKCYIFPLTLAERGLHLKSCTMLLTKSYALSMTLAHSYFDIILSKGGKRLERVFYLMPLCGEGAPYRQTIFTTCLCDIGISWNLAALLHIIENNFMWMAKNNSLFFSFYAKKKKIKSIKKQNNSNCRKLKIFPCY